MALIIPKYSTSRIEKPTIADYEMLGIEAPEGNKIELPTSEEVKSFSGVDLSYGVPLLKKGFFGNTPSQLYAASDDDCKKLGIRNDFVVNHDGGVMRRGYTVEDGIAYVSDPKGSLVEALARSCAGEVARKGALNLLFTIPGFPMKGMGLRDSAVAKLKQNRGTKTVDVLFPDYAAIDKSIPAGHSGNTSSGLEFTLY
jgi:hypothetical protein